MSATPPCRGHVDAETHAALQRLILAFNSLDGRYRFAKADIRLVLKHFEDFD